MESPKIFIRNTPGFTLIEILVVIALISVVATLSIGISSTLYTQKTFDDEVSGVLVAVYRARSLSMSNICRGVSCANGKSHGIFFGAHNYTVFEGDSFSTRDTSLDEVSTVLSAFQGLSEIVFEPLSGNVVNPGTVLVRSPNGQSSSIAVSGEGVVSQ